MMAAMRTSVPSRAGRPVRLRRRRIPAPLSVLVPALLAAACSSPPPAPRPVPPAPAARRAGADPNAVPPAAAAALRARFPGLRVVGRSAGRFQVDDADDLAVVLAPEGARGEHVVALLSSPRENEWRVTGATAPLDPGCTSCGASVDISQHALFVHVTRADGPRRANITCEFAYRDNDEKPRLVSVSTYQADPSEEPQPHAYANSANLATGRKLDELDDAHDGQPRHRELLSSIPLRAPVGFDQFSFAAAGLEAETRRLPASAFEPDAPLPAAALAQLQARFPGMAVRGHATGELHAPGARDVAVVLAPAGAPAPAGAAARANGAVVAVLMAQPDGSLALADVSPPLSRACAECDVQVLIGQRQLTVQVGSGDAAGALTRAYQFACRPADGPGAALPLRLVATRVDALARSAGGDTHRVLTTTNIITGDRLETTTDVVQGHPQHGTRRSRVPLRQPVMLTAFSLEAASGPSAKP
jgi:hypothetical protein